MTRILLFLIGSCFIAPHNSLAQWYDNDERAFLGINSNGISKSKAQKLGFSNDHGSYITSVIGNTAAEKMGLKPFDYIFGIDDYYTSYDRSLSAILKKYEPGDEVTIHFVRKGRKMSKKTTLGSRDDAKYSDQSSNEAPFLGVQKDHCDNCEAIDGVPIEVVSNSSAEEMGLQDGDIITYINDFPVLDWHDLGTAINMMDVGETMTIDIIRNDREMRVSGPIRSKADRYGNDKDNNLHISINDKDINIDLNKLEKSLEKMGEDLGEGIESLVEELENMDIDTDDLEYDLKINGKRYTSDNKGGSRYDMEKRDIGDMTVEMQDMTQEESEDMEDRYGVAMPVVNNLTINQLNLFPNPNMGMFELSFDLPERGNTAINIFNSEGRTIYNYDLGTFSGRFEDQIDISQNGTGTYFLQITQDNKSMVKKIILARS